MTARTTSLPRTRRVNSDRAATRTRRMTYEDGNTVRLLDIFEEPSRPVRQREEDMDRVRARARARAYARTRQKARARSRSQAKRHSAAHAHSMSIGFVAAITLVCIATVFFCIHYLQLRSQVIHQSETIAARETALSRLKADNDAYENKALASVNMEEVKETALTKLGMHYATESQIRYYNADDESYVRQYEKLGGG